ncbi:MAG TPA: sigma-70 family RNA polymerase sigma factor [Gemmatimonadales bacterium]
MALTERDFQRLYESQQPLLVRQLRRQYRALADEVEDVVQDSFDKLWRRFGEAAITGASITAAPLTGASITGASITEASITEASPDALPNDLGAWLFRTANNAMIDRTRMHKRRTPTDIDELEVTGSPADRSRLAEVRQDAGVSLDTPGLGDGADDPIGDALDVMHEVLPQLRERDRVLLTLKYIDGLSYDEIAPKLGLSRGALGTTLLRARRAAQSLFEEQIARRRAERGATRHHIS